MIGVTVISLAVLLVVLMAVDAKNLKATNTDKDKAKAFKSMDFIRGQFRDFKTNPLATKVDTLAAQAPDRSAMLAKSMDKMYLTWMIYSDSMCTDLMLTSTAQLDKCYLGGSMNGTAQYVWNTWTSNSDSTMTFMQSWYSGHCQSMNAMPTSTTSASYSMSCMPFMDTGMYSMVSMSAMLPARPSWGGLQIK
jgi:hypothetical protein